KPSNDPRKRRRHCAPRLMLNVCPLVGCEIPRPPALGVPDLENGAVSVEMKFVSVRILAAIGPHDFERHMRTLSGGKDSCSASSAPPPKTAASLRSVKQLVSDGPSLCRDAANGPTILSVAEREAGQAVELIQSALAGGASTYPRRSRVTPRRHTGC